jgi:hypothetical protein
MEHSLIVPDGERMVQAGRLKKLLKVICMLQCLALEVALGGGNVFLIRIINLLVIVILVTASKNCDLLGRCFGPLLLPLTLLFAPLSAALGGAHRLPPGTTFPSPWTKMDATASSPKACWVVMSSSSFVVFC